MIILTIPFKTTSDLLTDIPHGVEYIEYRLDYYPDLNGLAWQQFNAKTILTIRDKAEGGVKSIPDDLKCKLIQQIITQTPALIDVEYLFMLRNPQLNIPPERLIISLHTKLHKEELIRQFIMTGIKAAYYKLAVTCQRINELDDIISMFQTNKAGKYLLIPLSPCSVTARMLYRLYGSCGTYVYYQKPVTKNQLALKDALISRIDMINPDTYVYGIIGKQQVLESLSFYFYNVWFKETRSNRVFLPIVAEQAEEAISIINWLSHKVQVKGFAVTMPFKQTITPIINGKEQIINSWFPVSERFSNTDAIAFEQSIKRFMYRKSRRVIIYGRGATAQTALTVLNKLGYTNVIMQYRGCKSKAKYCKLLINCTPYGLKRTDNPEALPKFESLIDLPYGKNTTTLVKIAKKNRFRYIDGYKFWLKQARFQAAFFAIEPEFIEFIKPYNLEHINQ